MGIKIEQDTVIINEKTYKVQSWGGRHLLGKWRGFFVVHVFDSNNRKIDEISIGYTDNEFNYFWNNFNSGKFLYDELISKKGLNIVADNSVEDDFKNS